MPFFCCIHSVVQHVENEQTAESEAAQPGDGAVEERRDAAAPEVAQDVGQENEQTAESEVAQPGDGAIMYGDLGFFIDTTKSVEETSKTVFQMSDVQKYNLLKNHDRPSKHFIFPTQFIGWCNRAFKYDWLEEHGW